MRLSSKQQQIVVQSIRHHLGADARVWLFGSRVDDSQRGGDVDLYVETVPNPLMTEIRCKVQLQEALDLPVDLIVRQPDADAPIARIAKAQGVLL